MSFTALIDEYAAGPYILERAVAGMSDDALRATPVVGKWSTQQVVCHIADFEPVYADRMKRVLAEQEPALLSGDPDLFAAKLAYDRRVVEEELQIIELARKQMVRILRTLEPSDFQRKGIHSSDGPLTLETLLRRITGHIPHHVKFIEDKKVVLAQG
jgi:hypothetical protein